VKLAPEFAQTPEGWGPVPLGAVTKVWGGHPFSSDRFSLHEGIPLVRIRDLRSSRVEIRYNGSVEADAWIDTGDLLVGMDGDFNAATWTGGPALLNQRVACVRPRAIDPRFLTYVLPFPLKLIETLKFSTTVRHLTLSEIRSARVPLPPFPLQRAIASFLDRETAKIDTLIEKKERLLALLEEKRIALITQAVTKGLDPAVPMKDSGVEWLGEVPAHWEVQAATSVRGWAAHHLWHRAARATRGSRHPAGEGW
jgi:type I restriction enzyme, S subunit